MEKQYTLTVLLFIVVCITFLGGLLGFLAYGREPYTTVQETLYSYTKSSKYSVWFYLKPNEIYDQSTIPAESGTPIYLSLVEGIGIDYSYRVDNVKTDGVLRIAVLLRHPDGWEKKYREYVDSFRNTTVHTITINLSDVITYMDTLCRQIGLRLTSFNISITSYIASRVYVGSAVRDDSFTHTITIVVDLGRNRVNVVGRLAHIVPIEEKRSVYVKQKLFGLDVENLRSISVLMSSIGVVSIGALALIRVRITTPRDVLKDFESKYRNIIVSASRVPPISNRVIYISKPEEIVKISRLLEKPIIKYTEQNSNTVLYMVVDRDIIYILDLGNRSMYISQGNSDEYTQQRCN